MNAPEAAYIPAADARARAAAAESDPDALTDLLPWARSFARAPISGFLVGAVALGRSGALYAGANAEFLQLPLSASVHAEQAAVLNAWLHGERGLEALAVTGSPCGHCRQFLNELADASRLRIVVAGMTPTTLGELLPASFGPRDLGVEAWLLDAERHDLASEHEQPDELTASAVAAANASHAPYTRAYAGVALRLSDGDVVTGRYAESAAYNPSLPAMQAALVALALRRLDASGVTAAVLAEAAGSSSQRTAAEAALRAVAGIPLRYAAIAPRKHR